MKIYKALADFQQEVPAIFKGTTGYGYKYADWGEILKVINPLLKKHSLGFTQPLDGMKLRTIIFHTETGERIESIVDIPSGISLKGMNDYQVLGSAITYLKRYSLSAILGLVSDEDTDAQGEQSLNIEKANLQIAKANTRADFQKILDKLSPKQQREIAPLIQERVKNIQEVSTGADNGTTQS